MQTVLVSVGLLKREESGRVTCPDLEKMTVTRFLNRLLGLQISDQQRLFRFFSQTLDAVIKRAKSMVSQCLSWGLRMSELSRYLCGLQSLTLLESIPRSWLLLRLSFGFRSLLVPERTAIIVWQCNTGLVNK